MPHQTRPAIEGHALMSYTHAPQNPCLLVLLNNGGLASLRNLQSIDRVANFVGEFWVRSVKSASNRQRRNRRPKLGSFRNSHCERRRLQPGIWVRSVKCHQRLSRLAMHRHAAYFVSQKTPFRPAPRTTSAHAAPVDLFLTALSLPESCDNGR